MRHPTRLLNGALLFLLSTVPTTLVQAQPAPEPDAAGLVVDSVDIVGGELAVIAFVLEPLINDPIADGSQRILIEIRDVQDPAVQDDASVEVAIYQGIDLDGDPGDDFEGDEPFEIDPPGLNPDGSPVVLFTPGTLTAGALSAGPSTFDPGGGIIIPDILFEGSVALNGASFASGVFEGAVPAELFEAIPAPFPFQGTLLDVLEFLGAVLDVDLDGDTVNDAFSVDFTLTAVSCVVLHPVAGTPFVRGDCSGEGALGLSDAIVSLNALFGGAGPPICTKACDFDDNGNYGLSDPVSFLNFFFNSGPPPAAPFPDCGVDDTPVDDDLPCEASGACP